MKIRPATLLVLLAVAPTPTGSVAAEDASTASRRPRAVVELFTSQGCASCPPADAYLAEMSRDPGLVTLSFPVDYWDYLGWKDTAAKPEFTQRQRAYAARRGDHDVYTPQVVINGRTHLIGSDRTAIGRELGPTGTTSAVLPVAVDLETVGDALIVSVGASTSDAKTTSATVWIVRYDVERTVPIRRGENTGRSLTYAHLVRSLQPIGMWKGHALRIELPRQDIVRTAGDGCAVLVQNDLDGAPGTIVGARMMSATPNI